MSDKHTADDFLITALGASAGGLEALEKFFRHMPADSGIAFVVVQHLAPDRPTALPEILARFTKMPVEQVQDNAKASPNRVSIIPPNATLTIKNGVLRVSTPVENRGFRTPIDSLFSSLAEDRGENAVCIMLSGTGTDGTLGLRAIKEHGGMAMAQALETAKYDAILRSAIGTGLVDHVLPVEEMPAKLLEYATHLGPLNGKPNHIGEQIGTQLGKIHDLIKRRAGHDFSQYKESTIIRRMERRMKAGQIRGVEQYVELLEEKPEEVDRLLKDLLIGVTQFFRDPEEFEALGREVIPKLFEGKGEQDSVRACIVGCASGEEAYSIAILLCELASTLSSVPKVQIFATDIDERGLEIARKGRYPASVAEHVSPERLERFFIKEDGTYQIKRELREMCIFSNHSIIKDPPFSRLDLISCRNVMIYLEVDLQRKVFPLFHYALRPGGYLFLGPSESATSHRELFRTADKKHRIFQRKDTLPRPQVTFSLAELSRPSEIGGRKQSGQIPDEQNLLRQLERLVLQKYRPACITVRENGDAVYFSGRTGRYLEQPTGALEANVVNMAREGLRIPLRTALHKAVSTRERAMQKHIPVQANGGVSHIDLSVEPILEFPSVNLYMIVFEDAPSAHAREHGQFPIPDANSEEIIRHLESELRSSQEQAQAMYEELESSNEELKSANEEYQSTNEELETSKEEIQSFNEELETVNTELNRKVAELDHLNSDLQNLLNSTQIATIFLGADLRIKNFTPAGGSVFRLIAGDIGRPITDLAAQLSGVDLVTDINEVLRTLTARERQLAGAPGQHYQMRILPYRTVHNVIDGVVLTFTDVSTLKEAEEFAQDIVDTVREPLLVLDGDQRVKAASKSFYETFRVSAEETLKKRIYALGDGQWSIPELQQLLVEVLPANKAVEDFRVRHAFPGIGDRTMLLNGRRIEQQDGKEPLILLAIEDITERTRLEESQGQLSAIVESSDDAIISSDVDGIIRSWNRGAERLLGYQAEEVIGKPVSTLAAIEHADEIADMLQRLFRGERIEHYETTRRTKDGRSIPVSIFVSAIKDSSGAVIGASKIIHDITEQTLAEAALQHSEERYRTLFESIDEGFCIIEMIFDEHEKPVDYRFLQVNPSFERQTGLKNAQGKTMRELVPQHEEHWFETYGRIALTGEPARFENSATQLRRWFDVYAFRFGEPENRQVAMLFKDISERKRTQDKLQSLNLDLQHFAYAASHDLQEPLRMVMSYTQLLARQYKGKLDQQADHFIAYAVQGAERMETLLRDLREYCSVNEQKHVE
ncbi:MAG: chemotaxis protein CheB, partial [Bryobacteraceae bacterium]